MKLSELTYQYLDSIGLGKAYMHYDCSDALRLVSSEFALEEAKKELMDRYGDVELVINPDEPWYNRIKIDDAKWQSDNEKYCDRKAEWCNKYGCN